LQGKTEVVSHAHDDQLQQQQPQTAREQELRELFSGPVALPPEKRAHPRGKHEHGRAEMRDPARQEQCGRGPGEIRWREEHGVAAEEIPDVVQGHDNHHQSPQRVDGGQPQGGFLPVSIGSLHYVPFSIAAER
jgi:hypothetical protein